MFLLNFMADNQVEETTNGKSYLDTEAMPQNSYTNKYLTGDSFFVSFHLE